MKELFVLRLVNNAPKFYDLWHLVDRETDAVQEIHLSNGNVGTVGFGRLAWGRQEWEGLHRAFPASGRISWMKSLQDQQRTLWAINEGIKASMVQHGSYGRYTNLFEQFYTDETINP